MTQFSSFVPHPVPENIVYHGFVDARVENPLQFLRKELSEKLTQQLDTIPPRDKNTTPIDTSTAHCFNFVLYDMAKTTYLSVAPVVQGREAACKATHAHCFFGINMDLDDDDDSADEPVGLFSGVIHVEEYKVFVSPRSGRLEKAVSSLYPDDVAMRKKIYTVGTGAVSAILKTMNPDKILGIEGATVENICIEYDNNQDNICTKDCIARGGKNESCVVFSIAACVIVTAAATIAGARV